MQEKGVGGDGADMEKVKRFVSQSFSHCIFSLFLPPFYFCEYGKSIEILVSCFFFSIDV